MEQNRKEAEKFSDLAKAEASPFLRSYYWHTALRYLSSEGELSVAQDDSHTHILSEKAPSPSKSAEVASRIPPMSLAKAIEQRASQASLAAMNQDRSLESENTERADDRHTLDALKRLYLELLPLGPSAAPPWNSAPGRVP
jgi:hypothetical protein